MSIKLKDLAKELGVSPSTISKVINNRPGVSEELRIKIVNKIEELNLRPKQTGGFIKDDTINVNLFIRINQNVESDPFYSLIQKGISSELQTHKYNLLLYVLSENKINDEAFKDIFATKNISGNILIGADYDEHFLKEIRKLNIPTVLVDGTYPGLCSVNSDNFQGALKAIKYLQEMGHEQIAFLSGPLNHESIKQRYNGYAEGLNKFSQKVKPVVLKSEGVSVDDGYKSIMTNNEINFTALFAANDKLAIGAMKALKEKGYSIPEDISIVGFDDIEWGIHTDPALTTIRVPKLQSGLLAARLFMDLYNNPELEDVNIKVGSKLIVRDSVLRLS
ncbi:LacI family transcriptional regulator [Bacillus sp. IITD106]|nr:LacI family transcriptional regulator [Bacillus sp. IITD106]